MYDRLANMMFDIILDASSVKTPVDTCWTIQHNTVWSSFFRNFDDGKARKIILFKLRRLLYDEIVWLGEVPNYKSSRILGLCLNVMGIVVGPPRLGYTRAERPLQKVIIPWTKKNFMTLRATLPDVAESVLMGGITFDEGGRRLVKTYAKGLSLEPPRDYLDLDSPPKKSSAKRPVTRKRKTKSEARAE